MREGLWGKNGRKLLSDYLPFLLLSRSALRGASDQEGEAFQAVPSAGEEVIASVACGRVI